MSLCSLTELSVSSSCFWKPVQFWQNLAVSLYFYITKETSSEFSGKKTKNFHDESVRNSSDSSVLKRLCSLSAAFPTLATDIPIQPQWPLKRGNTFRPQKSKRTSAFGEILSKPCRAIVMMRKRGMDGTAWGRGSRWHGGTTGSGLFHFQPSSLQSDTEWKVCPPSKYQLSITF